MLRVESVSKRFSGGHFGVRDVSFTAKSGVLGLLGPNGAGKSTLMQMMATVTRPTAGQIFFDDIDIQKRPDDLRRRLGYLPQDFGVYDNLTALEFLTYFAALKGVHNRARVMEMLEIVNLHSVADRTLGGFSGGMKQRLGIAQALINDPHLVIVDEPTAGLDPEERVRFRNLLSDLSGDRIVILSTHIVSDVEATATHIALIAKGRLLRDAAPEALLAKAEGRVWELMVPAEALPELRRHHRVSGTLRRSEGVQVRVVSEVAPAPAARAVAPTLEDAYLLAMAEAARAVDAGVTGAGRP